ncbi:MAG: response regulator [Rickettsiales bacterium]|nr:response regulator [Rickettsiales bacterium]
MSLDRKVKILCVEDENEIRENISEILRDEGFEVFEAENGKKGFEVFLQEKPDLIISDIMMPELDGYGLLKMVREGRNVKNNNIPFIFLSALGQRDSVIKGVELSANDYLVKPIDFDLMIAKVKEKTANSFRIKDSHERNIKNIKNQVATILPNELFSYLDIIIKTSSILKEGANGDYLSSRTAADINRIYLNAIKLKGAISNSLDSDTIEVKLNSDEEVFAINDFFNEFNSGLSQKIRDRIIFDPQENMPRIKADKSILIDAIRRILASMFRIDGDSKVEIRFMIDHLDQLVMIFYFKSDNKNDDFAAHINEEQIAAILDKQNCQLKVVDDKEKSLVVIIPKHRLIKF